MIPCANVGSCRKPPFSEPIRDDGFVPDQVTQAHPLIDECKASFEGFSLSLERPLCRRLLSVPPVWLYCDLNFLTGDAIITIEVKAHHRRILDLAAEDNPTNARVDAYKKSVGYQDSLAQGWIEELPKPARNSFYFRITPTGTEARYQQKLEVLTKRKRKPLAMAKPRVAALPNRVSPIPKVAE